MTGQARPPLLYGKQYGTFFIVAGVVLLMLAGSLAAPLTLPLLLAGVAFPLFEARIVRLHQESLQGRQAKTALACLGGSRLREDAPVYRLHSRAYRDRLRQLVAHSGAA